MDNDTQAPRRVNFLLRRVVVPNWLFLPLILVWATVVAKLIVAHPLLTLLAAAAYVAAILAALLRQRHRPPSALAREFHAAPDMRAALAIVWRQMRTYPVWLLVVLVLASIDVVSGWMGYFSI